MDMKRKSTFRPRATRLGLICLCILAPVAASSLAAPAAAETDDDHGLGELINARLRAGGPFFTAEERAVIERACGYASGEWDGLSFNTHSGVLHCTNGRRVSDPAVRQVFAAAEPRIERRVSEVMESPEVIAAIDRITDEATASAMAAVRLRFVEDDD